VSKGRALDLIRELAVSMAPECAREWHQLGHGGEGNDLFRADRLRASLTKYIFLSGYFQRRGVAHRLAAFYAERTLTNKASISRLRGSYPLPGQSSGTLHYGHVIPVDAD